MEFSFQDGMGAGSEEWFLDGAPGVGVLVQGGGPDVGGEQPSYLSVSGGGGARWSDKGVSVSVNRSQGQRSDRCVVG